MDKVIWGFVVSNTIFGIGHHIDHALRHKTGWPVTHHVTPFTYAFAIYVVILVGVILTRRGVVGPGYWWCVAAIGFVFIGGNHYGPVADDPPAQFAAAYGNQTMAWIALVWLWLFLTSLAAAMVYTGWRWVVLRQPRAAASIA